MTEAKGGRSKQEVFRRLAKSGAVGFTHDGESGGDGTVRVVGEIQGRQSTRTIEVDGKKVKVVIDSANARIVVGAGGETQVIPGQDGDPITAEEARRLLGVEEGEQVLGALRTDRERGMRKKNWGRGSRRRR